MKINSNLLKTLFYFTLILNGVFVLQVFGSLGERELDTFFNSDGLYLPSIYKDLFVDRSGLAGWHLNAAPNFFPEWPLYFLVRFLSGNFKIAGAIYSLVYVLAVNLLTVTVVKRVFSKIEYTYLIFINIGFALFLHQYLLMGYFYETAFLFFVGFHGGAYFMALLSLLFFIIYLQHGKIQHLVFLILTVCLGALSDRLLIMYFVVPSLLVLALAGNREYRKRIFIGSVASVLATVLGMVIYDKIKHGGGVHIIGLGYKKYNLGEVGSAFSTYVETLGKMMKAGDLELVIVVLFFAALISGIVFSFYVVFGKGRKSFPFMEKVLIIFMSGYIPIVALTPIMNGTFLGLGHLRYNYSAFYVAVSFFAVVLYLIRRKVPMLSNPVNVFALLLVLLVTISAVRNEKINATPPGLKALNDYYPEEVKQIDELAEKNDLHYGVGNYWFAKKTTMFSKQDVRIYSALEDLRAWFHVTNQNWYFPNKKGKYGNPRFNFVLTNDLHPEGEFFEQLQEKSDTLRNGNIEILKTPEFAYENRKTLYLIEQGE